uniref:Uncharacterized protein n=1 Tax=Arundo donax TaxID=35708 RepID=A0A0A9AZQ0_ARUDO
MICTKNHQPKQASHLELLAFIHLKLSCNSTKISVPRAAHTKRQVAQLKREASTSQNYSP